LTLVPALINVPITLLLPLAARRNATITKLNERETELAGKMEKNEGAKLAELSEQDQLLVRKPAAAEEEAGDKAQNTTTNGFKIWPNLCNVFGQKIQVKI
jgi:hypothetical protein